MPDKLLLSIPEACYALSMGRSSFYKLVSTGKIKVLKFGRKSLVAQSTLREFVEQELRK